MKLKNFTLTEENNKVIVRHSEPDFAIELEYMDEENLDFHEHELSQEFENLEREEKLHLIRRMEHFVKLNREKIKQTKVSGFGKVKFANQDEKFIAMQQAGLTAKPDLSKIKRNIDLNR